MKNIFLWKLWCRHWLEVFWLIQKDTGSIYSLDKHFSCNTASFIFSILIWFIHTGVICRRGRWRFASILPLFIKKTSTNISESSSSPQKILTFSYCSFWCFLFNMRVSSLYFSLFSFSHVLRLFKRTKIKAAPDTHYSDIEVPFLVFRIHPWKQAVSSLRFWGVYESIPNLFIHHRHIYIYIYISCVSRSQPHLYHNFRMWKWRLCPAPHDLILIWPMPTK